MLHRKVDWKLPELGFQKLSNSYPKLEVKVEPKLTFKVTFEVKQLVYKVDSSFYKLTLPIRVQICSNWNPTLLKLDLTVNWYFSNVDSMLTKIFQKTILTLDFVFDFTFYS